uniref:Uncharacterized protein n=1 Tax=Rhizophora mucronata TaxID=61149 RepID=A0A2P2Q984_RHIMU
MWGLPDCSQIILIYRFLSAKMH